ncbi:MAG: hypothetical protein ACRBBW_12550 [Cellvibrionaceae bacterium]
MNLSFDEAILKLDTVDFSSRESVKEFLGRIDANDASGTITLLYGGDINDASGNRIGSATELAKQVADSDQRIRVVDNTSAAEMLQNTQFLTKLAVANGVVDEFGIGLPKLLSDRDYDGPKSMGSESLILYRALYRGPMAGRYLTTMREIGNKA